MSSFNRSSTKRLLAIAFVASFLLVSCGDDDSESPEGDNGISRNQAPPPQAISLSVSTHEFKFDAPSSVSAGAVEITVTNQGKQPHEVQLMKLNEGVTYDQFADAAKRDGSGEEMFELAVPAGGAGASAGIPPGETITVTNELEAGAYALVCLVEGHNARGMIAPFDVTEGEEGAAPPVADAQISLSDFQFILPDDFTGNGSFEFVNNGPDFHEAALYKLDAPLEEVEKYLDSPKAFRAPPPGGEPQPAGVVSGIEPTASAFAELSLDAGTYVFICFFPDDKGRPHAARGMYKAFEVL